MMHDDRGESDAPRVEAHADARSSAEGWACSARDLARGGRSGLVLARARVYLAEH